MAGRAERDHEKRDPDCSFGIAREDRVARRDLEGPGKEAPDADAVEDVLQYAVGGRTELVVPHVKECQDGVGHETPNVYPDDEAKWVHEVEKPDGLLWSEAARRHWPPGLV